MNSSQAVAHIFKKIGARPVVLATGFICRQAQAAAPRPQNFYMNGSMGMASSIGLGAALARPKQPLVVIDGDGAVLMNLGNLPMVGAMKPANFLHVVLDNARYESTGGQPSLSGAVDLGSIAKSSLYRITKSVRSEMALRRAFPKLLRLRGPSFLLVRVRERAETPPPRIVASPETLTRTFSRSLRW